MKTDNLERLTKGFRNLRKQGYFARQSFWCCQTCGCAAVPADKHSTYAFYHKQDADALLEALRCGVEEDAGVYLSWAGDAQVIRKAFEDAGCKVDHNGDEARRIWVQP